MISLVIPTYNERQNVAALLERTGKALGATGQPFEVIVVDDHSPDRTAEEVRRLQAERPWLRLLLREGERDLSTAVTAGWREAGGDIVGCMDGDLQQPPELLPRLYAVLNEAGADIAVASRNVPTGGVSQWSLYRRLISWTATLMATVILPGTLGEVRDPMSGYFLFRRPVIDGAPLNPVGYKILLEVLAKGDYRYVVEVPFVFEERALGESKLGAGVVLKYLAHLVRISAETREAVRIVKYATVGLTGVWVNFMALRWLVELRQWPLGQAAVAGVALAILNNFVWNELLTFPEARRVDSSLLSLFRRLVSFAGFSAAGAFLNFGLIALLIGGLGLPLTPGVLIGIAGAGLWNFATNSNLTWRAWWNRKMLSRGSPPFSAHRAATAGPLPAGMMLVACNLCGSARSLLLHAGDSRRAPTLDAQAVRCTSERHGEFSNIVQCADCGLIYQNPRDANAVLDKLYAAVDDPVYEREAGGRVRTFARLVKRLDQHIAAARARWAGAAANPTGDGARGRLLDIGCYTGVFLEQAQRAGWEVCGLEPSAWAAAIARQKGFQVVQGPFRDAHDLAAPFDAVTLWDVVEHLTDPLGDLQHAGRILKPGGVLGLSTMDASSLFARLAGRHWPWYMRMHLTYFTPDSIRRMLERAGFEVLAIERHERIVSLRYFLEKAASNVPAFAALGRILAAPFGNVYSVFQLGDIMNVFARRL